MGLRGAKKLVEISGPSIGPSVIAGAAGGGEEAPVAKIVNTQEITPAKRRIAQATAMFLISIVGVVAGGEEVDAARRGIIGNAPEMRPGALMRMAVNTTPLPDAPTIDARGLASAYWLSLPSNP